MHASIGGFEQALAGVVERVGIVRRNHDRRRPLETMLQRRGPAAVAISGWIVMFLVCPLRLSKRVMRPS